MSRGSSWVSVFFRGPRVTPTALTAIEPHSFNHQLFAKHILQGFLMCPPPRRATQSKSSDFPLPLGGDFKTDKETWKAVLTTFSKMQTGGAWGGR